MTKFKKLKVMVVAGTRPEWIRQACVIHALRDVAETVIVHTGQNLSLIHI